MTITNTSASYANLSETTTARALWYTSPGASEIVTEHLPSSGPDDCLVRTIFTGISRGTESLIWQGRVSTGDYERMRAPFMGGTFPFPVKYGYANVGVVEQGPAPLLGRVVFSLSAHQSYSRISAASVSVVGLNIPTKRAILAANMETALNAVWNASPGPADRIAIVGGGVVGLLVGYLCARLPGAQVTLIDLNPRREREASALGMDFALPDAANGNCDVVIHASGVPSGLNTAIELAGDEASIVELSWFGEGPASFCLGGAFHSRQLKLIASQVGHMAASHRPRWDYARRLAAAITLLDDPCLDILLADPIAFENITAHLPRIFNPQSGVLCQPILY